MIYKNKKNIFKNIHRNNKKIYRMNCPITKDMKLNK